MRLEKKMGIAASLILLAALLSACNGGLARRSTELLARDYQTMTDVELRNYYHQLSDQLAREARASRAAAGLEFDPKVEEKAEEGSTAVALRERWNAVRAELRQRELLE